MTLLPVLSAPAAEPVVVPDAEVLLVTYEQAGVRSEALLPAGLVPTSPMLVTMLVVRAPAGPLGPFAVAQVRLSCRSGARARALVAGQVVDAGDEAAAALAAGWGIGGQRGPVRLQRGYDVVRGTCAGFDVSVLDPSPIGRLDVQYVTGLHPVSVPGGGERLVQVEFDLDVGRVERGRPALGAFDGAAWDDARLAPRHPVAATIAVGTWTLPVVRFLLRPDVAPHLGTERVAR